MDVTFEFIKINEIKLHTAFAGPTNGEPIILLHGFPDAWFGWENQIPALVEAGYRVIIPDQRGYNLSDKPKGKQNYRMELLVQDLIGLMDNLKIDRFHLVGHDFGAMVAWWTAIYHPERIKKLVISNVPHPQVMKKFLRRNLAQLRKSWYAFFFRIPGIPEKLVRVKNWRFLSSAMAKGLTEEQLDKYREAWSKSNAMTSMINWYRAFGLKFTKKADSLNVTIPTRIIWGKLDPHLSYKMALNSIDMCRDAELITFDQATHWVHQDEPDRYNDQLLKFFKEK